MVIVHDQLLLYILHGVSSVIIAYMTIEPILQVSRIYTVLYDCAILGLS